MSDELAGLKERNARLSLLIEISNVIHATLDPEEALNLILREAVRGHARFQRIGGAHQPDQRLLEIQASQGPLHGEAASPARRRSGHRLGRPASASPRA